MNRTSKASLLSQTAMSIQQYASEGGGNKSEYGIYWDSEWRAGEYQKNRTTSIRNMLKKKKII